MNKSKKASLQIAQLDKLIHATGLSVASFLMPALFALGAALFDGLSMGLLVPLAKGVIEMDFTFVRTLPVFKTVIFLFPGVFIKTSNPNSSIFILLLGTIFTATLAKNILSYFSAVSASYQASRFSKNIKEEIFAKYMTFGKQFFDRTNIGHLNIVLSYFTYEVGRVLNYFRDFMISIFTLTVYLVIMFFISWRLAVISLVLFPALYYSLDWLIRKIKKTSEDCAASQISQVNKIIDMLSCLPLVKSYAKEEEEKARFSGLTESVAQLEFSGDKKMALINPLQELVVVTLLLFIISVMTLMLSKGQKGALSNFLVFFYMLRRCAPLFNGFNNFKSYIAKIEGPIQNVSQIFDDKDKFFVPEGSVEFKGLKDRVEFKHLNFSYANGREVLKDVSFASEKGAMTAIVGPTGSGKTTIVNLILRFYDCPSKAIFIDGIDIRDYALNTLMPHIALVSQDAHLFNETIRYNIVYGAKEGISDSDMVEVAKKAKLYDFIMELPEKFETLIGDRGVKLSGGEKQRLSIARAFLKRSEILILDEATSSLDTKTERLIQEAIDEVIKDKTAIVIAHRLSTIKHADKIVVIEGGRIVEEGDLQSLLGRKGKFYEYWQEQKFD